MSKRKVPKQDGKKIDLSSKLKFRFTEKQEEIVAQIRNKDTVAVFIDGPSGSSKTFLSVFCGLEQVISGNKKKLLYIRSAAESGSIKIGARPGDISEKMDHLVIPLRDKLDELLDYGTSCQLRESGAIEAMPINDVRGSSWNDTYVIVDESQNLEFKELVTVITRIGMGSQIIFVGDSMQSDIRNSGWRSFFSLFRGRDCELEGAYSFQLDEEDIVRSPFLRFVIKRLKTYHHEDGEKSNFKRNSDGKGCIDWSPSGG